MKVSLGRIVIYRFTIDPDAPDDELNGVDVAAIVTAVNKDGTSVMLTTFQPGCDPGPILSDDPDDDDDNPEGGEWIPFSETPREAHWRWPERV